MTRISTTPTEADRDRARALVRHITRALLAGLAACAAAEARAGDPRKAEAKATTVCAACHGPKGKSTNPLWPHLAGQQEAYLVKAITDYRDGKREDAMMGPMAKGLSDEEIADLAAYYAAQPPPK